MDFGLKGRNAIVCAASEGLGRACARSLAEAGVDLVINTRLQGTLLGAAKSQGISVDEARTARLASNPSRRFGDPNEFGATCAFIASVHAGYITGQNILLDGGAFPGTF